MNVKQAQALNGIVIGGAVSLLATQPVWAAATQVTGVQLNPSGSELKLILETKAGDTHPQIFTVHRGNDLVTDIVNTQLSLSQGDSFRQRKDEGGRMRDEYHPQGVGHEPKNFSSLIPHPSSFFSQ
ncbi:MAG TPA: AMIN domain-containing protein, partial [Oculatellaceae cyanobacterium]